MQYLLFGGQPPHQKHSPTSKKAAAQIKQKIGPLHKRVLDWLADNPNGGTDEGMGAALNIPANTFRPRRRELQLMKRIKDSTRTAPTASGRSAVIWILT